MTGQVARRVLALLVAAAVPAFAEEAEAPRQSSEPQPEVLVPDADRDGGWAAPVVHVSGIRDRAAVLVGARGGWLIGGRLTLGGGGFGLATRVPAPPAVQGPNEELDLELGYGGGWVEYTFSPLRLVHVSVGALVGGGSLSLKFRHGGSRGSGSDDFFVAEPAVVAELNLVRWARLDVGAAYRWIVGAHMAGLSRNDVSGPSAIALVKFGRF